MKKICQASFSANWWTNILESSSIPSSLSWLRTLTLIGSVKQFKISSTAWTFSMSMRQKEKAIKRGLSGLKRHSKQRPTCNSIHSSINRPVEQSTGLNLLSMNYQRKMTCCHSNKESTSISGLSLYSNTKMIGIRGAITLWKFTVTENW